MGKIKEVVKGPARESGIDKALEEMEREEVRRAKLARLKEYRLESEMRTRELERKLREEVSTSPPFSVEDVEAAKMISELPDDQRRKVLAVLATIRSAGRSEPSSVLVPLIIASMMSNPSANKEETASVVVKTLESVSKIVKEAREESSKERGVDLGNLITGIAKLIESVKPQETRGGELERKVIEKFVESAVEYFTSPPRSWLEDALSDPKKVELLQKIFGKSDLETLKLLREMKRDDREFQLALKKLDIDTKLKLLQLREEARKRMALSSGFKKVIRAAAQALEEEGGAGGERESDRNKDKTVSPGLVEVKCEECGETFKIAPDARRIVCPKCKSEYKR